MLEEKHVSGIIKHISDRFTDTNDKDILRSVIMNNFKPYNITEDWTVCGNFIDSLEENIGDDIVNQIDKISFSSHISLSYGIESLRSMLYKSTKIEQQLFFWLAKLNEKTRRKHIIESENKMK